MLCGGGVGIAPLADLAGRARPRRRACLLGFRDAAHAEGAAVLGRGPRWPPTTARSATTASSPSCSPRELDGGAARGTVYACGPPPMLEAVRALCAERDVPAQLALESGMACGFGACFGCVVPDRARLRAPVRRRPGARRRRARAVVA